MKRILALLLPILLLVCPAFAEDYAALFEVETLSPFTIDFAPAGDALPMYCGPTQGAYAVEGQTLDLSSPFVVFGQYDCWAMAASGTPERFGPVGWVEAAALDPLPYEPQLGFEDALEVYPLEGTSLMQSPFDETPLLEDAGDTLLLLAVWGDWAYVQWEDDTAFLRGFVPCESIL